MKVQEKREQLIRERIEEDIRQMKTDDDWGLWPKLPLINRETDTCGYLLAARGPIVFLGNVFAAQPNRGLKEIVYTSFESLAKLWRVD